MNTMSDQLTLFERLGIFVKRDFLDIPFCQQILAETRQTKISRPGQIYMGKGESVVDESARKVQQTALSKLTVQTVYQQLRAIQPQLEEKFKVKLVGCEGPNFLFYQKGGFYLPHTDRDFSDEDFQHMNKRRVTAVIFVNGEGQNNEMGTMDTYEGGALMFYELLKNEKASQYGLSLNGQPGLLVAFDSDLTHEVQPVTAGERLTIVTWFLGE